MKMSEDAKFFNTAGLAVGVLLMAVVALGAISQGKLRPHKIDSIDIQKIVSDTAVLNAQIAAKNDSLEMLNMDNLSAPAGLDTAQYLDVLIVARMPARGKMDDLFTAIDALPATSQLHSFHFLSFAPDSVEDYMTVLWCPDGEGKPGYCTGK